MLHLIVPISDVPSGASVTRETGKLALLVLDELRVHGGVGIPPQTIKREGCRILMSNQPGRMSNQPGWTNITFVPEDFMVRMAFPTWESLRSFVDTKCVRS